MSEADTDRDDFEFIELMNVGDETIDLAGVQLVQDFERTDEEGVRFTFATQTLLPGERIVYAHVAGHYVEAEDLRVDTHGADVIDPVWDLLERAYAHFGVFPTLLERDFNIPPLVELTTEVDTIASLQHRHHETPSNRAAHG